jgi:TetR/AcrR family transcriptional repressor of nem operon
MARQSGMKEVTKVSLLDAGVAIMVTKGYNNTGIQEVLEATGVPKGSFYYYFDSKEDFAIQIIEHFDQKQTEQLKVFLDNQKHNPVERLKAYCNAGRKALKENQCRNGCLVGNLSQEMADQSEVLRAKLEEVLSRWRGRFAQCIKEGQEAKLISSKFDHNMMAEFFQSGWHGAIMRAKTTKTTVPLDAFMTLMFDSVLKP